MLKPICLHLKPVLLVAGLLAIQSQVAAQSDETFANLIGDDGVLSDDARIDLFRPDTDFPSSPAFAVLGEDPSELQNVRNYKDLGFQILTGLDNDGSLKGQGLSFEGRPFWWGDRSALTFSQYNEASKWYRMYQRTHFSVATVSEETEAGEDVWRTGIALTTELLDRQDIRSTTSVGKGGGSNVSDFTTCLAENAETLPALVRAAEFRAANAAILEIVKSYPNLKLENIINNEDGSIATLQVQLADNLKNEAFTKYADDPSTRNTIDALYESRREELFEFDKADIAETAYTTCLEERQKRLDQAASVKIGIAHALTSQTGKLEDFEGEAKSIWISGRYPTDGFIKNSSITGFIQYEADKLFEINEETMENAAMPDSGTMMSDMGMMTSADAMTETSAMLEKGDRFLANVGLAVKSKKYTFAASASYIDMDYGAAQLPDEDYTLISVSASRKLRPGVWLEFGLGASDSDTLAESEYVNVRLKFDWNKFLSL